MKKIKVLVLILLTLYLSAWMYYETRCNAIAGSHAEIRFDGVYCWLDLGGWYTSGRLGELEEAHGRPPLNLWNDPRFYPIFTPIATVEF